MKWAVQLYAYSYVVKSTDKFKYDELIEFLRHFDGTLIVSETDKILFASEIEKKVQALNAQYASMPVIIMKWIEDNPDYAILCGFECSEFNICHIVLNTIHNIYRPKGGEQ